LKKHTKHTQRSADRDKHEKRSVSVSGPPENPGTFHTGYVAIVGEPNVGKSTLLNALLQQKISIVTRKPQTTRQQVLGILTTDTMQAIFLDTPGLLEPKYLLHEAMVQSAHRALEDADAVLVLTDVTKESDLSAMVAEHLAAAAGKPLLLCLNKLDKVSLESLLPLIDRWSKSGLFKEIIPVSAAKSVNVPELLKVIAQYLPEHPPFYPPDIVSEQPERFFVAEMIRERIFERYHDEIPYSTAVEITEFKERETGKTFISADIIVERDSQKGILIGKGGLALKNISQRSRIVIEKFIGKPVYLELHVKVGEEWREKESWIQRLGYRAKGTT